LSEFKATKQSSEMETTKATARLPGLDMEIVHRRAPDGEAEQISIHLQAVPSFEALGHALEGANPFALWAEAMRLVWLPWFSAVNTAMLPWSLGPHLPAPGSDAGPHSTDKNSRE
jgi:hypothetical protein